jgi:hypothetical protein
VKLPRRNFLRLAAGAAALPAVSRVAWAQAYPSRPVRMIVPFAPGGVNDIAARLTAQWLSERLGQSFVIENRPGGGANIGIEAVVRAPADGYTLLLVGTTAAINATLFAKLNYNFIRDIAPVASIIRVPHVMQVNPSVPVTTVAEFIAYAKANPGQDQHGLGREREPGPCDRRAFQDADRPQSDARTLSRRRTRADRSDRRANPGGIYRYGGVHRIHPLRQAARIGGNHCHALRGTAGHPDRWRFRAGLMRRKTRHPDSLTSSTSRSMRASPMARRPTGSPRSIRLLERL